MYLPDEKTLNNSYRPDERTVDVIFSKLEWLAFRGKWDDKEKNRVWNACGVQEMDFNDDNNYFHDRLSLIMNIYSTKIESNRSVDARNLMLKFTKEYLARYPYSKDNLPPMLRKRVEAENRKGKEEGD